MNYRKLKEILDSLPEDALDWDIKVHSLKSNKVGKLISSECVVKGIKFVDDTIELIAYENDPRYY